ncbi:MAG: efflux RND transporter permease subunit [Candidatus Methanofishera endochildressiae]|uniref:Efflux RND transporter permease subunit n=1 Tax=Candidatus Methanofishera endochildressiae TaxID=2738884 RepID=A0A7Z0SEK3_9GAMM|nr:efflux RND transporter permease subunit [Candidatus Methanofishera endochildressiae]
MSRLIWIYSLTLSPASSRSITPRDGRKIAFRAFNSAFDNLSNTYATAVETLTRLWGLVALAFIGLCALALFLFSSVPSAFVPQEDQGYLMVITQLPAGASFQRTQALMKQVQAIIKDTPGVSNSIEIDGYNLIDGIQDPSPVFFGTGFYGSVKKTGKSIMAHIKSKTAGLPEAVVMVVNAPPIPGLGSTGGFNFEIQDLNSLGVDEMARVVHRFISKARQRPELAVFHPQPGKPNAVWMGKAKTRGLGLDDILIPCSLNPLGKYVPFNKLGVYTGSICRQKRMHALSRMTFPRGIRR